MLLQVLISVVVAMKMVKMWSSQTPLHCTFWLLVHSWMQHCHLINIYCHDHVPF